MARKKERKKKTSRQNNLPFGCGWGGFRPGAGRKKQEGSGVSHKTRELLASRYPVLVTIKLCDGLPSLRNKATLRVLKKHLAAGADRFGFRLVHYAIQKNHLHLICEAKDSDALARGMQGLKVRLARGLNKMWGRRGTVWADRYHARILRTPREVRNAIAYVLHNGRRHGHRVDGPDPYSSAGWFDGWKEDVEIVGAGPRVGVPPNTWLLRVGWRRHGLIGVFETPRGGR